MSEADASPLIKRRLPFASRAIPGFGERSNAALYWGSLIFGIVVWQLFAATQSGFVLAPPVAVFRRLGELTLGGVLPKALVAALGHMVLGYLIACLIALPVGLAMGRVRFVGDLLGPVVTLVYAVPSVAWAPFLMIWCGLYFKARVALVVLMCVFDMIIVLSVGARNADRRLLDVGRSFGTTRWQNVRYVLLPESLSFVFTALRIGAVRAVNAMITAELFLAAVNLGSIMKQAAAHFDSAAVLGVLFVLCLLGLLLQEILLLVEARICTWRPGRG
ncbi:NitT/TauT family transport system permease protein [Faunimonas pinastri]|uniref:NitT/TauT family transport system permease protein n=1 Tax=Faunimonas pinastri TaxID=1855383 RepID=A0A1H9B8F2_9HYPH|nr:ABC transporter permease subunit [Faunimonas pinastri]SEP84518.1 NitT/TauT family transport system permease protein [Faunimonas pinastri]